MPTTTLTSKGQVTIPKAIREQASLKQGDRLDVKIDSSGRILIEPVEPPSYESLFGLLKQYARERPVTVEEMNEAIRRRAAEKDREIRRSGSS